MGGVTGQGSSAQYAPISSQGIMMAQESYGLSKIAELEAEENGLIAQARAAQFQNNYKLLGETLKEIRDKRAEKLNTAKEVNELIRKRNARIADDAYQASIDNEVAGAFTEGVTDAAQIVSKLNKKGVAATFRQVNDALKGMAEANKTDLTGLDASTREFFMLRDIGELPPSIKSLPTAGEQLAAYVRGRADGTFVSAGVNIDNPVVQTTLRLMGITKDMPVSEAIATVGMDKLVDGLIKQEGGSPKGVKNNPGNIKFVGLPGQIDSGVKATDGGTFASYATIDDGKKAVANLVEKAAKRNDNLSDFVASYKGVSSTTTSAPVTSTARAWADRISSGQSKITEIKDGNLRNQVVRALAEAGNREDGKPTTTELGKEALSLANDLSKMLEDKKGTSIVGGSRVLTLGKAIPGTDAADFKNLFDSIKSKLSLEGTKYLKGQGQVSDAERKLLAEAVSELNLAQSEEAFKASLKKIINKLSGNSQVEAAGKPDNFLNDEEFKAATSKTVDNKTYWSNYGD
jgi:hypothetical protein